jgi:hypothetical protein
MDVSKPQVDERADSFIQFSGFESLRFRGFQAKIYELKAVTVSFHTHNTQQRRACVCVCVVCLPSFRCWASFSSVNKGIDCCT